MHVGSALLVLWLILGAVAAGPLNYAGVNPKVDCTVNLSAASR
ncbi:MAG TPA: hypothetical protein VN847_27605 [Streptosporangiaceae bacterium]|nr:hypothetical protein [Streptosporangiaceae bacterium]